MSATTLPHRASLRSLIRPPAAAWVALALVLLASVAVPRFATLGNLENVLRVASILCIVSCGQAVVLILGGIEFSFGSSVALASIATILALPAHGAVGGFSAGIAVVLGVGVLNGFLVAWLELPAFIVTLGMLMALAGLASTLAGGLPIDAPESAAFAWPASGRVFGIPVPIIAAASSLVVLHTLLSYSRIGRIWYLAGSNTLAARLSGLPVRSAILAGYLAAAGFCAIGAVILTSRVGSGQPQLAPNLPFETIAACAIGGIPLAGGRGRASQVVCGVAIVAVMNNLVVLLNLPVADQQILMAGIILGAMLLDRVGEPLRRTWRYATRRGPP